MAILTGKLGEQGEPVCTCGGRGICLTCSIASIEAEQARVLERVTSDDLARAERDRTRRRSSRP